LNEHVHNPLSNTPIPAHFNPRQGAQEQGSR
jgi:hypothetical protein